jgi:hypothetical protein
MCEFAAAHMGALPVGDGVRGLVAKAIPGFTA